jgi:hypothetical protein
MAHSLIMHVNFQSKINVKNPVLTNKQTRVELYARVASYTVSSSQCNYGRMKARNPSDRSKPSKRWLKSVWYENIYTIGGRDG